MEGANEKSIDRALFYYCYSLTISLSMTIPYVVCSKAPSQVIHSLLGFTKENSFFFFLQNNLERRENTDKTKEAREMKRIKKIA